MNDSQPPRCTIEQPLKLSLGNDAAGSLSMAMQPAEFDDGAVLQHIGNVTAHRVTLTAGEDGFEGTASLEMVIRLTDLREYGNPPIPQFLLPGFFYGNGRREEGRTFPRLADDPDDPWASLDWNFATERLASPIAMMQHLDSHLGLSWSPHYVARDANGNELTGPKTWGEWEPQLGVGFAWKPGPASKELHEGSVTLRLNLPANESPRRHARNPQDGPTSNRLKLPAGATVTFDVQQWEYHVAGDGLSSAGLPIRPVFEHLRRDHPPAPLPSREALAEYAHAAIDGLLDWHWRVPDDGRPGYMVYTVAYDRSAEFNANNKSETLEWHFEALGFVGGFPIVYGLMWYSYQYPNAPRAKEARNVAEQLMERFCKEAQTDWGFFRTSYHPGRAVTSAGSLPNPAPTGYANDDPTGDTPFYGSCWLGDQRLIHARTTADASQYLARTLLLMREAGESDSPLFLLGLASLKRSLEAAMSVLNKSGQFGQIYNLETQSVEQEDGHGGMLWIVVLSLSLPLFENDPTFHAQLNESLPPRPGPFYDTEKEYGDFINSYRGWIADFAVGGAPEDVGQSRSSENAGLPAYLALHLRQGGKRHFTEATWSTLLDAADYQMSWRKAYNVKLPPKSIHSVYDFRTSGGDLASEQNNHLHLYELDQIADLKALAALLKDYQQTEFDDEATQERYHALADYYDARANDHLAFALQMLALEPGHWNAQRGMCSEQLYTTDWSIWGRWDPTEAHHQKGTLMGFSHSWCVNMILIGIAGYLQLATSSICRGGEAP